MMEAVGNKAVRTYPAYKDSGEDWIGEIPSHWEVKRLKYVLTLINDKEPTKDASLPYIGMENIESKSGRYVASSIEVEGIANKFIKGDVLFGKLRPYLAKVHLAEIDGLCSSEFLVYRVENPGYFQFLLISDSFINWVDSSTYGAKMPRASSFWIGNQFIPYPPLSEQAVIATFLDRKTARIDQAIDILQRQIGLLKERKQILIQQAVTRGLNPEAPLKDSGVPWIGQIPAHWEVKRLKYVLTLINEKELTKDSSLPYIGMENIESKSGRYVESNIEVEGIANKFIKGDVLFGKLRPYLAKVHLAEFDGLCSSEFLVYRVDNPEYYHFLLISDSFINLVDSSTYGAKMPRANTSWVGNQFIPCPPLDEQTAIATYLENATSLMEKGIGLMEAEITQLKEYRSTLINSIVTGKINVC